MIGGGGPAARRNPFARARAKRRAVPAVELSLAAMVDMMINILIFLLHLYGKSSLQSTPDEDLQLAKSTAKEEVKASISVVVSTRAIRIGSDEVVALEQRDGLPRIPEGVVDPAGHIAPLADRLEQKKEKAQAAPLPPGQEYVPELLVETDRRIPWSVLGPVLRSGARAGIENYRFVVASQPDPE